MGGGEQWLLAVPVGVVYVVAFVLPFAEAAAFVGLVVPGETALLLAGVVAGLGRADPLVVAACGIAGAVAGDSVGFEIGRRLGPRLTAGRLGRAIGPARWARAEGFVRRYGAHAVFLGRWVGFARALVPALAGATGLDYRRFLFWNALSGAVWASTVTLVGYLAGHSWQHVERVFGEAVLLVLLVGAAVWATVAIARWVARHPDRVRAWASRQAARPNVRKVLTHYDRQVRWLARRFEPRTVLGLQLTTGVVLVMAAGWFFGSVLQDVIVGEESVRGDGPVLRWLAAHRDSEVTAALEFAHRLTGVWGALATAAAGTLLTRAGPRALVSATGGWALAVGIGLAVAALVGRPGPAPEYAVVGVSAPGAFPAVGVACTTAVAAVIARLGGGRARTWGRAVAWWTVAVLWAGLAGVAVAYLGAGWATDVLGGWVLGGLSAVIVLTLGRLRSRLRAEGPPAQDTPPLAP
ncbi:VTT domain-containing protein [Nocardiopsis sp. NPDC101807]|uniref:VTT domain-containing protein n=1 Tax=Nocardiopsis sp. NPDC101807 TaxID=3364339 RepID=UPI003822EF6E